MPNLQRNRRNQNRHKNQIRQSPNDFPLFRMRSSMDAKDIKMLANHIAEQPFLKRRRMIYKILKDLGKHIEKEDSKAKDYVV